MTPEMMLQQLQLQQQEGQREKPPPHVAWELELKDGEKISGTGYGQVALQGPVVLFPQGNGGHMAYATEFIKSWVVTLLTIEVMVAR